MQKLHLKVRYFHLNLLDYTIFLLKFLLNGMVILTTNNSLHVLADCHTLFVEGTFKPPLESTSNCGQSMGSTRATRSY